MSTIYDVVREICLGMPETEEVISHGFPHFKVAGKGFATYSVNHHGDGKVALLLQLGRETQTMLVESAPKIFFIPPYSGPSGWVGVELNQGLDWARVSKLSFDAWSRMAPLKIVGEGAVIKVKPPTKKMRPEDIDPLQSKANQALLKRLRTFCLSLPEVIEDKQFGDPAFRAGKKTFCTMGHREGPYLQFWVGSDRQVSLSQFDKRFKVPPYIGHRGWINLNLPAKPNWDEIEELLMISYEHFALKRMLKAIGKA